MLWQERERRPGEGRLSADGGDATAWGHTRRIQGLGANHGLARHASCAGQGPVHAFLFLGPKIEKPQGEPQYPLSDVSNSANQRLALDGPNLKLVHDRDQRHCAGPEGPGVPEAAAIEGQVAGHPSMHGVFAVEREPYKRAYKLPRVTPSFYKMALHRPAFRGTSSTRPQRGDGQPRRSGSTTTTVTFRVRIRYA